MRLPLPAGIAFVLISAVPLPAASPTSEEAVTTAIKTVLPEHPRLLYRKDGIPALLKKADSTPELRQLRDTILKDAGTILAALPLKRVMTGTRLLSVSRDCLNRVTTLGMAWQLTGDTRFSQRAKDEMLTAAGFTDWNPSHFLDVGEMTAALALGYDWLYPALDQESRQTIRTAIIEKGLRPSLTGKHFWM